MGYRLLSYALPGAAPRAGLLLGERVVDLEQAFASRRGAPAVPAPGWSSLLAVLQVWDAARDAIETLLAAGQGGLASRPLASLRLCAPVLYPGAVFGAGANYRDHFREMRGEEPPPRGDSQPFFFLKTSAHSVVGPEAEIPLPAGVEQLDWEAEIGAVIGRATRNVSPRDALASVAGYLIVNDLSARDRFRRSDSIFPLDWIGQKCFDASCPMGPWLTPAEEIPDPQKLSIRLWVDDVLMQDSHSGEMIFSVAEQIAWLSRQLTLRPGDVIATGTPAGVGARRGMFLRPGHRMRIAIEGLGELCNPVVTDPSGRAA
jgi:2-keto-4-pentenoate hydratase/2-oxohepta-3-ene-1,7-dioic acid hydratase in catechol pathway